MAMAGLRPVDALDVGLGELLEELAGVGAERLDVAALPLGVDGVEGERRLARAARPGEDDDLAARQTDADVLQVVLPRADDDEPVHGSDTVSTDAGGTCQPRRSGRQTASVSASAALEVRPEVLRRPRCRRSAGAGRRRCWRPRGASAGIVECVVDAGWTSRLRTSPRLTACVMRADALEHAPARVERGGAPAAGAELEREERAVGVHLPARERVPGVRGQRGVVHDARRAGASARRAASVGRRGALLALAEREGAQAARDEERGERRDDPAEALHDEVADARRRRSRRPHTQPPMASPWPPRALVIEWTTTSTPSACGVCAKGVANVLSASVVRPRDLRERDDGRDVGDGEVRVRGRLDVEDARARADARRS